GKVALEARRHLGAADHRAVVKAHPLAQRERPHEAVPRDAPAGRQRGIDFGRTIVERHKRIEDLAGDERGSALERDGGIELDRQADDADAQLLAPLRRGVPRKHDEQRQKEYETRHRARRRANRVRHHPRLYSRNPSPTLPVSESTAERADRYGTCSIRRRSWRRLRTRETGREICGENAAEGPDNLDF